MNSVQFLSILPYSLQYNLINSEELLWVGTCVDEERQKWKKSVCTSVSVLDPDRKYASLGEGVLFLEQCGIREDKKAIKNQDKKCF